MDPSTPPAPAAPLAARPDLLAIAREFFEAPLPSLLARAVVLELLSRETGRTLHIELGGEPPLPDELDELYAKADEGLILDIRWGRVGAPSSR